MNTEQLSFFQSINAQLRTAEPQAPTGEQNPLDSIAVLDYYGFLAIEGPDTTTFLQGQTTCDLDTVNDNCAQLGAFCTPKGRIISSFLIACDPHHHLLRMRLDLVASTADAISKYIAFSKATQRNASEDYTAIGLSGACAGATIEGLFGTLPGGKHRSISHDGVVVVQLDERASVFECWIPTAQLPLLWPQLSGNHTLTSAQYWQLAIIRQGQGEVSAATSELFIPQMLNFHRTGAISFTKGCYTGQEVIARMQYKGKLKRHMYRVALPGERAQPGDDLYSAGTDQSIGKIVNCITTTPGRSEALAVITRANVEADNVLLQPASTDFDADSKLGEINENTAVKILSLPYTIAD